MAPRRRIDPAAGLQALTDWQAVRTDLPRQALATAVRYSLEEFATRHSGRAVEIRVPPFGVTQAIAGPTHTRGTPPNVVETDAQTWLAVCTGEMDFAQALSTGAVQASGTRADLSDFLPLVVD